MSPAAGMNRAAMYEAPRYHGQGARKYTAMRCVFQAVATVVASAHALALAGAQRAAARHEGARLHGVAEDGAIRGVARAHGAPIGG